MKARKSLITHLNIVNFRNHTRLNLETDSKSVMLHGANGSGKTNILEAISILAPGRGLRNAPLSDLINYSSNNCHVSSKIINLDTGEIKLDISISPTVDNILKKTYFLDDKLLTKHNLLEHYLSCIWLTPQMDNFFLQDNSHKRKFIDRLVFLTNKNHLNLLTSHDKLVKERNQILQKHTSLGISNKISSWLTHLETELAQLAVSIVINRNNFFDSINDFLKNHKLYPSKIYMTGEIEDILNIHKYALPVENILKNKYENTRLTPALARNHQNNKNKLIFTNIGAHKSKLVLYCLKKELFAEQCSTGEQKMLLISLITSVIEMLISQGKIVPCLLLDEIGVHLDDANLFYVIEKFLAFNTQMFITHTNADRLKLFEKHFSYLKI